MAGITGFPVGGGAGRLTMHRTLRHGSTERNTSVSRAGSASPVRARSRDRARSLGQAGTPNNDPRTGTADINFKIDRLEHNVRDLLLKVDSSNQFKHNNKNNV